MSRTKKKKYYSENFKREAVLTYESSEKSAAEICRLLDISCGSLLRKWCMIYGKQEGKDTSSQGNKLKKDNKISADDISAQHERDASRIADLEGEVKRLRQALGNHAAKDYLATLREESWRELSAPQTLQAVEKLVAKKL